MLVIGGAGHNLGAIVAAIVVWGIWTGMKFLPGYLADPNFRIFMVGLLILAAVVIRPGGVLPTWHRKSKSGNPSLDGARTGSPPGP
jgi:branched-chain amino acid transport system permease protein